MGRAPSSPASRRGALVLGVALLAAGSPHAGAAGTAAAAPLCIVTSFYPMYVATLNIAGGVPGVRVRNLTPPLTGCLHDYQLTPADMVTLTQADVFVVNGGGMEAFLDKATRRNAKLVVVDASAGIPLLPDASGAPNPHVWVSVSAHRRQVANIAAGLEKADPARAAEYAQRAAVYAAKLERLALDMHAGLRDVRTRDIITFHEAFPYFAQEFGLRIVAVVEREPGSEPSARELAATVDLVRQARVKALFAEPQYPRRSAAVIARETGAKVYLLDPAVTGAAQADAYIAIMRSNLKILQDALR